MTDYYFQLAFNYSIVFAAVIGIIRYQEIFPGYRPFVFICFVALVNELVSHLIVQAGYSNAVNANCYILLDSLLWLLQFRKWGAFRHSKWMFPFLVIILIVAWITEYIVFHRINIFSSWFRILYSFCLVFLSINIINRLIVHEKGNLMKNAQFLICLGVLIFYTYKILVESFYLQQIEQSLSFFSHIYAIVVYVNLFVNLLFAIAALWIPTRQKFSLRY